MFNKKPKLPTREELVKLGLILENPEEKMRVISCGESPEEKQLKNIAIALKGIQKELEHLNRTMRK